MLPLSHDEIVHGKMLIESIKCQATNGNSLPIFARCTG